MLLIKLFEYSIFTKEDSGDLGNGDFAATARHLCVQKKISVSDFSFSTSKYKKSVEKQERIQVKKVCAGSVVRIGQPKIKRTLVLFFSGRQHNACKSCVSM